MTQAGTLLICQVEWMILSTWLDLCFSSLSKSCCIFTLSHCGWVSLVAIFKFMCSESCKSLNSDTGCHWPGSWAELFQVSDSESVVIQAPRLQRCVCLACSTEIVATLQKLHPRKDWIDLVLLFPPAEAGMIFSILQSLISSRVCISPVQISSSPKGTAVDQFGWDSQDMWDPFT